MEMLYTGQINPACAFPSLPDQYAFKRPYAPENSSNAAFAIFAIIASRCVSSA